MEKIALIIALFGLLLLALYLHLSSSIEITRSQNVSKLLQNQKVHLISKITQERQTESYRILTTENNLTIYCSCSSLPSLKGKDVEILGIIDTFQKSKIKVLKIKWLSN